MSWTDRCARRALVSLAALGSVGALTGCGTTPTAPTGAASPITPTEQYSIQVELTPDQLALAPRAEGLSEKQRSAIAGFAQRWRETGRGDIAVRTPGGAAADRTVADLMGSLEAAGVPADNLLIGPYEAAGAPGAPVMASFLRYEARAPNCEEGWDNFASTGDNRPSTHFGCATTANLAAMIADPRHLIEPAPMTPGDGGRRAVVLQKYREGQVTSAARDDQAVGVISNAVNQ